MALVTQADNTRIIPTTSTKPASVNVVQFPIPELGELSAVGTAFALLFVFLLSEFRVVFAGVDDSPIVLYLDRHAT